MKQIFVNLKRFDVPRRLGGVCPVDDPKQWIEGIIAESVQYGLGQLPNLQVTFLLPEALIIPAKEKIASYEIEQVKNISVGCQGVYRENIAPGGNFGAFTTNLPAAAAKNLGCAWALIGHSEERKDKLGVIGRFEPLFNDTDEMRTKAARAVDSLINEEVIHALNADLNVLLCVGETAEQRGGGSFAEQQPRIKAALEDQLTSGLKGVADKLLKRDVVIGYEPVWAIGPGKTPPDGEYISFVSAYIKAVVIEKCGFDPAVVYGGGLKEENAGMIAQIKTIGGGLVALTKFSGDIAFEPAGLKNIIKKYVD
jgi:triosephosphate isomerase